MLSPYHENQYIPYEAFGTVGYFRQIWPLETKIATLSINNAMMVQARRARVDPHHTIPSADWDAKDAYYVVYFEVDRGVTRPRSSGALDDGGDDES